MQPYEKIEQKFEEYSLDIDGFLEAINHVEYEDICRYIEQYADLRAKEAARDVRHKAVDIVNECASKHDPWRTNLEEEFHGMINDIGRDIMNIQIP